MTFSNIDVWPIAKDGNSVRLMAEDRDGFLWIGSTMGVYRYDGIALKGYFQSADPHSINENVITSLYRDADHAIWIGTSEGGLNKYDPVLDRFERILPPGNPFGPIRGFPYINSSDSGEVHWIPAGNGLLRYDVVTGASSLHAPATIPRDRYWDSYGFRVALPDRFDPDLLWVAGLDGLYKYLISIDSFEFVAQETDGAQLMIHDLFYVNDSMICGGSWGGGIMCYSNAEDKWSGYLYEEVAGRSWENIVFTTLPADAQHMWVATKIGFGQFDVASGTYLFYRWDENDPAAIDSSFWYSTLYRTHQGNIAVTRANGLSISSHLPGDSVRLQFPPLVSGILIDGIPLHSDTAIHYVRLVEMEGDDHDLSLNFITPGNYSPAPVRFAYRLQGYDRAWQEMLGGRTL
ncbi:MAG: two-component regulator propeller domain-containing protein, partial [Saprospiraceae bacterium]|nr:two-component regulator propeller domain-containing protein [Saprospiraceae bacterium]